MSAQCSPVGMDLSEVAMRRNDIVEQSMPRLEQFAWNAFTKYGMNVDEFVVVCIVVDSCWRDLVDLLMPNATDAHWQAFRNRGELPIARGIALAGAIDIILERLPDLRPAFEESYPEGTARCVMLDDSGGTLYQITAKEDLQPLFPPHSPHVMCGFFFGRSLGSQPRPTDQNGSSSSLPHSPRQTQTA